MTILETVKQTITNSGFSDNLKDRLSTAVLPLLDKQTLTGLDKEISDKDNILVAEKITALWERFGRILSGLKKGEGRAKDDFLKLLAETRSALNEENRVLVLNLVADVRSSISMNRSALFSDTELWDIVEYEISLFRYLPADEISYLLEHYLLEILDRTNLLVEMQIAAVDVGWYEDPGVPKTFMDILLHNRQRLSTKPVVEWLQEFIKFDAVPPSQKTTLHVAEFLVKDHNVSALTQKDKLTLSEILNLFLWCLKPKIEEEELGTYKREIEEQRAKYYQKLYEASMSGTEGMMSKYFWPEKVVSVSGSTVKPLLETKPQSLPVNRNAGSQVRPLGVPAVPPVPRPPRAAVARPKETAWPKAPPPSTFPTGGREEDERKRPPIPF